MRNANAFTRAQDNSAGVFGQDMATFLLGLPTGGTIDRNGTRLDDSWYHGMFVQDDWKVSNRLTLNLGVRYEYEGATRDTENRNVRGFDPAAVPSIAAAARAAYAANPIPELPPSAFTALGGLQFASASQPGFWNADKNNVEPRVGFAYQLNQSTVVRGGVGVYTVPFIIAGSFQPGFSQTPTLVPTLDNGLTFRGTLSNPFPDGVQEPSGSTRGADTFLGQDLNNANGSRFVPLDYHNAQNMRYMVSVQRELPGQWLIEAGYAGSRGFNITTGGGNQFGEIDLNGVPAKYLSTSRQRDQATIDFLTALMPNPFGGLLPGTSFNGATIARQQLPRPFPQFGNLRTFDDNGSSRYNSAQVKVERRFTRGYSLLVAYTASRFTERVFKLNPTDTEYENRLSEFDVPHRLVLSGIWELPFGRERHWANSAGRFTDALIGGWSVQGIAQFHAEFLNAFNTVVFNNPNTDPTSAEFGKVTSQNNLPRDIQLALKLIF